jgi:integrase
LEGRPFHNYLSSNPVSLVAPELAGERPVFGGFTQERFLTAIARACRAAGIAAFSLHDLRHRRISLLHAQGLPWARIGEFVGHADLVPTAGTYTHVLAREAELDDGSLLA